MKNSPIDIIALSGAKLIRDGAVIFTYCYSTTVLAIFKKAKQQGKKFTVICSETRPNFTGRMMAKALIRFGIDVTLTPDSSALGNMLQSDVFFFGADLITADGRIINKSGTAMMVFLAKANGIPTYVCASSAKIGTSKEAKALLAKTRPSKEMWDTPVRGIHMYAPAYDVCCVKDTSGLLTENGLLKL